jgi:YebC/PmpR family DNA-binding regulatory protein
MSGHSKWSTIKRKKGAADAKRGQLFTRLAREIVIAVREGGGDPETNFRLRLTIDRARGLNMPKENIDRAIKRGTGEDIDGAQIEQITYEGYAPHGIALMIDCLTETAIAPFQNCGMRSYACGGSMGEVGSVSWQFDRIAYFGIEGKDVDFDKLFELALEGALKILTRTKRVTSRSPLRGCLQDHQ